MAHSANGTNIYHIVQAMSFSESFAPRTPPSPYSAVSVGAGIAPPAAYQQTALVHMLISSLAAAILYFDFFLTLPAEVDRYWTGNGCSWASLLFFMNRYMSIFCHIPIIYEFFWSMPESVRPPVLANFALYCSLKSKS